MKTRALRIHGKDNISVDEFELPPIGDGELLARIVSDSLCMSTYKAVIQGTSHKRIPEDVENNPVIIGHECCGVVEEVGKDLRGRWKPGDRFVLQPALGIPDYPWAPGYSFPYIGGDATYVVIPSLVIERGCLIPYTGSAFFGGSLCEPMSCIISAFREFYHSLPGIHQHDMGIKENGSMIIMAGCGPMGLGAVDYALHGDKTPSLLVVTDIDSEKLARAEKLFKDRQGNTRLVFLNTSDIDAEAALRELNGGKGYDDILVMAPVKSLVALADSMLGFGGCLSFFAGPTDPNFTCELNFYNLHYSSTHFCGTFGGGCADMEEAVRLASDGTVTPALMVTHIGGLDSAEKATLNLPKIPGGKKLIYTNISFPLTAIDLLDINDPDPIKAELGRIVHKNNGLWCAEAEEYLLSALKPLS